MNHDDLERRLQQQRYAQHLEAVLLAGAVGDAIGNRVDALTAAEADAVLGDPVVPRRRDRIGDDTQLTLFTFEGLMRAHIRWLGRGIANVPLMVGHAIGRWARIQGIASGPDRNLSGWLSEQPEIAGRVLFGPGVARAASGLATRHQSVSGGFDGNGAVSRMAVTGLIGGRRSAARTGPKLVELTHHGVLGIAAGTATAWLVGAADEGIHLPRAVAQLPAALDRIDGSERVAEALQEAVDLALARPDDRDARAMLGSGAGAVDALALAVHAVVSTDSVAEAVRSAAVTDGISSTPAALAGQLAAAGRKGPLPRTWRDVVPVQRVINRMAQDWSVVAGCVSDDAGMFGGGNDGPFVPGDIRERFPGA